MNLYADLRSFKYRLLTDTSPTDDNDDALYLEYLEMASRDIDNFLGGGDRWRHFSVEYDDRLFIVDMENRQGYRYTTGVTGFPFRSEYGAGFGGGIGGHSLGFPSTFPLLLFGVRSLIIPDLISISDIQIADKSLDKNDFDLYPLNNFPKVQLKYRHFSFLNANRVVVGGKWGYADLRTNTGYSLAAEVLDDTDVFPVKLGQQRSVLWKGKPINWKNENLSMQAVPDFEFSPGQTLLLSRAKEQDENTDNLTLDGDKIVEQCYITSVAEYDDGGMPILFVERGKNGTVATTFAEGTTLEIQKYPLPIKQSCIDLALRKFRARDVEWQGPGTEAEGLADILSPIAMQIQFYRRNDFKVFLSKDLSAI